MLVPSRPSALLRTTLVLTPTLLLATAAPALAGTVTASIGARDGAPVLLLTGSSDADQLTLDKGENSTRQKILPGDGTTLVLAPGDAAVASRCTASGAGFTCSLFGLGKYTTTSISVGEIDAELGDGDDQLHVLDNGALHGLYVDGGAGNDQIVGGREPDHFLGGDGNDALAGYIGSDWLEGGDGNDFLNLAPNDDNRWVSPADTDDARSSCGPGTDMALRDADESTDVLTDMASCETDIGAGTFNGVVASVPNVVYFPGDVLTPSWTFTRSQPTTIENTWQNCSPTWVKDGNALIETADNCVPYATGASFTIPTALLGQHLRVTSQASYSVPGNPVVWSPTSMRRTTSDEEVRDVKFGPSGPSVTPVPTPTKPIATILSDLTTQLLASAPKAPSLAAKGKGIALSVVNPTFYAARVVVSLTVDPKAIGKHGKNPILVARGEGGATNGPIAVTVAANTSGKALAKRLGKKKTVKATLKVWAQVGTSGPTHTATQVIALHGG